MSINLTQSYQAQLLGKAVAYAAYHRDNEAFKANKERLNELLPDKSSESFKPIKDQYHKSYRENYRGISNGKTFVIV